MYLSSFCRKSYGSRSLAMYVVNVSGKWPNRNYCVYWYIVVYRSSMLGPPWLRDLNNYLNCIRLIAKLHPSIINASPDEREEESYFYGGLAGF